MSYKHALAQVIQEHGYSSEADYLTETLHLANNQDALELSQFALKASEETDLIEFEKLIRDVGRCTLRILERRFAEENASAWLEVSPPTTWAERVVQKFGITIDAKRSNYANSNRSAA